MHPWHDLSPGTPDRLLAFIEIGKGMRTKYELDKYTGLLRMDRILYGALHYPINYGIVPQTLAEDNDPQDILVFASEPLQPGCILFTRLIGVLHMVDQGVSDDKLMAVPVRDPGTAHVRSPEDLSQTYRQELQHFFQTYTQLEGKEVTTPGFQLSGMAVRILQESLGRYSTIHNE